VTPQDCEVLRDAVVLRPSNLKAMVCRLRISTRLANGWRVDFLFSWAIVPPMFGRRSQWFGWVLLLTFVLGGFACLLDCAADDCDNIATAHTCSAQCVCQTVSVLPDSVHVLPVMFSQAFSLRTPLLRLPVFCADIFQPPRV
jgi:hypothetical protein